MVVVSQAFYCSTFSKEAFFPNNAAVMTFQP
jgi:hypothetical protein